MDILLYFTVHWGAMTDLANKQKPRWGKKFKDKRHWPSTNELYVVRGMYFLDLDWVENWDVELEEMNRGKVGHPYEFPESLIQLQGLWKAKNIPYRMIEGITRQLFNIAGLPAYNNYTTVCRRINRLDVQIRLPEGTVIELTFEDGTGFQAINGGEYLREKYGKKNRMWVQVVMLGDPKTKEPVGFEVNLVPSSEPESAIRQLENMIEQNIEVKGFGSDGAMDDKRLWNACDEYGINAVIKPDKDARSDGESPQRNWNVKYRNKHGYDKWAKKVGYGMRWPATEGIFSAIKRIFGEQLLARSDVGLVQEAGLKVWAYHRLKHGVVG